MDARKKLGEKVNSPGPGPILLKTRKLENNYSSAKCQASFVHATFVDEIWKTICNLARVS